MVSHTDSFLLILWAVIKGMLYGGLCAVLLWVSWEIITHPNPKPRPMWEPRKGQDH